jgi:hypothetical protein
VQERLSAQPVLQPVEHREQLAKRLLIGGLGGRKSGAVDAVVDRTIDLLVQSIDLGRPLGRSKQGPLGAGPGVEHADDVARFVVDDRFAPPIPQHRHRGATDVIGIRLGVDLP